ncbi:hypothetical protein BOSE62_71346 [Bosea sp. 62]|jgi:hypothetical protein|uniref:hypothetical protein n=1 Tax=unclassified Bosea (in: a-proteobacteria) TaxID=2653178 RepID=UPI001256A024|nr:MULTISPECIES: hypothetical protein [unclassified Bosea (in: a-proteobacteria)]CAD5294867.1 hypothetical protein BOSE21B_90280 [Bosea sp. 21B]CAD5295327.1 hypothetical protein BOSE46_80377 [Bosea sp. 46]CAD5298470.1 hypothetical protein BOSE7B_60384 [Bosea sp. 7B]VVT60927.1 hypothetical protein BOS5A_230204 [Bosea sp. EC-HK365B]VXB36213.1 hypothetical protein BOSE127_110383 [Bosea sp. 127]
MPREANDMESLFQSLEKRAVRDSDGRVQHYEIEPDEEARRTFMRQLLTLTGGDPDEYDS